MKKVWLNILVRYVGNATSEMALGTENWTAACGFPLNYRRFNPSRPKVLLFKLR